MGRKWIGSEGSFSRVQLHKETEEGHNNRTKGKIEKGYGSK